MEAEFSSEAFRKLFEEWRKYLDKATQKVPEEVVEGAGLVYAVLTWRVHEDRGYDPDGKFETISPGTKSLWEQFLAYITI